MLAINTDSTKYRLTPKVWHVVPALIPVDAVGVDLVGVDVVGVDIVGGVDIGVDVVGFDVVGATSYE